MAGAPLTPGLAEARLRRMMEADTFPELGHDDVADLLELAKVADADGLAPGDEGWAPSWHLSRAAAEGWRRKAAKAAGRVDVNADGAGLKRSQLHTHCLAMARLYAAQGGLVALPLTGLAGRMRTSDYPVANGPDTDADVWPGGAAGGPSMGYPR
jgi:hypothetical protein